MINVLTLENFNHELFMSDYNVYHLRKRKKLNVIIRSDSPIFVYSSIYTSKTDLYILTPKNITYGTLYEALAPNIDIVENEDIPEYVYLSLMINSLNNIPLKFNNTHGNLRRIIVSQSKNNKKVFLRMDYNSDYTLTASVETYNECKDMDDDKKRYYIQDNILYLYEDIKGTKKPYIKKSYSKSVVPFYNTDTAEQNTKVELMFDILNEVEYYYSKYFDRINFVHDNFTVLYRGKRINDKKFLNRFSDIKLNVVIKTDDESILDQLNELEINYEISDSLNADMYNLVVINDKDYYKNNNIEDEHVVSDNIIVQHIIPSTPKENKTKIKQCLLEMKIKEEAITKHIKLFDFSGEWEFYTYDSRNDIIELLAIVDNKIIESDISGEVVLRLKELEENCKIVVHDGKMLRICDTNLRLLPDYNKLNSYRRSEDKKSFKDEHCLTTYHRPVIDIGTFTYNGQKYYSIGVIGTGMKAGVTNSPSTKKIDEFGLNFEDIIGLFKESIMSLNKYAVYPYPFKLLSELRRNNG